MRLMVYMGLCALMGAAQELPRFEVASVKRAECAAQNTSDPGMIAWHGDPLSIILMEAFKVKVDQIQGPSWMESTCFSIDATIPQGISKEQVPLMLRALLAERLKLQFHKASKQTAGYGLVVDKGGLKCKMADPDSNTVRRGNVTFRFGGGLIKGPMTMAGLARQLSIQLKVPVEDQTGLKDKYEIDLSWEVASSATEPVERDVFSALRNGPGLRLERTKLTEETVVVEHVEQTPVEN